MKNHSADALKPCPFCGDEMRIDTGAVGFATGPGEVYVICDCGAMGAGGKDQDEAIAAWNRRPTPAPGLCADLNAERINPTPASPGIDIEALRKAAEAATPGPWMRLFGERTVYDRMSDGCRGNAIVRADLGYSEKDASNLDYIAAANPAAILALLDRVERAEADSKHYSMGADAEAKSADEWRERALRAEAAAGAVPEGYVLVPIHATNAITCAIERQIDSQLTASGMDANAMFRQDGDCVWDAAIAAAIAAAPKAAPSQQAEEAPETNSTYIHRCERCNGLGHVEMDMPAAAPSEPVAWNDALKAAAKAVMHLPLRSEYDSDTCKAMAISANAAILNLKRSASPAQGLPAVPSCDCAMFGKDCKSIPAAAPSEPVAWPERLPGQLETDVPWRNMQPDWVCSFLTEYARFDGAMLLRGWNAMRDALLAAPPAQDAGTGDALLIELRDWFEAQRKAISKGCGSTWDMGQCAEQIEKIDRAIANSGRTE